MNKKEKCKICHKEFTPNRPWQKYCSLECRKEGKVRNTLIWRDQQAFDMEELTIEEIKNKNPYKQVYENIMLAFSLEDDRQKGLSGYDVYSRSGLTDKTRFERFMNTLCRKGVFKKESGQYIPLDLHNLEPLQFRQKDVIINTDMNNILFRSPFTYYNPKFTTDAIKYRVKNLSKKVKNVERLLYQADNAWMNILIETRDDYVREIWDEEILCKRKIDILTKFCFSLDLIFKICEDKLIWLSPPEKTFRSFNERLNFFAEIQDNASDKFLYKKYPELTPSKKKKLDIMVERSYGKYDAPLQDINEGIRHIMDSATLQHMLVVDYFHLGRYQSEKLMKTGIVRSNEPIDEQLDELHKLPDKTSVYSGASDKDLNVEYGQVTIDERLYVKPPFFKDFFKDFEKDLMRLGFKSGNGDKSLGYFYNRLDGMAEILRIPSLPDDLDALLQQ